jgi:hypothetical protein
MTDKSVEEVMDAIVKVFIMMYDLTLLAGTAYLVEVHNWSMWTFLLAAMFFFVPKKVKESDAS